MSLIFKETYLSQFIVCWLKRFSYQKETFGVFQDVDKTTPSLFLKMLQKSKTVSFLLKKSLLDLFGVATELEGFNFESLYRNGTVKMQS